MSDCYTGTLCREGLSPVALYTELSSGRTLWEHDPTLSEGQEYN